MANLSNKVAIVSGGATMIGWKAAQALRDGGAKVVLADIAEEEGERVAEELGQDVFFQRTDITDDEQIDACIVATTQRFGGVDCLINVACCPSRLLIRKIFSSGSANVFMVEPANMLEFDYFALIWPLYRASLRRVLV